MWPGKAYHFLSGGDGLEEKVKLYFIYGWAAAEKKSEESKVKFLLYEQKQEVHLSGFKFIQKFVSLFLKGWRS